MRTLRFARNQIGRLVLLTATPANCHGPTPRAPEIPGTLQLRPCAGNVKGGFAVPHDSGHAPSGRCLTL
jgi:hypothetical protein